MTTSINGATQLLTWVRGKNGYSKGTWPRELAERLATSVVMKDAWSDLDAKNVSGIALFHAVDHAYGRAIDEARRPKEKIENDGFEKLRKKIVELRDALRELPKERSPTPTLANDFQWCSVGGELEKTQWGEEIQTTELHMVFAWCEPRLHPELAGDAPVNSLEGYLDFSLEVLDQHRSRLRPRALVRRKTVQAFPATFSSSFVRWLDVYFRRDLGDPMRSVIASVHSAAFPKLPILDEAAVLGITKDSRLNQ